MPKSPSAFLDKWLNLPLGGFSSSVSTSSVRAHINADSAFESFCDAVDSCSGDESLVVFSGWDFTGDTLLKPGRKIDDVLTAAAKRGVPIRALFAHFPLIHVPVFGVTVPTMPGNNAGPVAFINGLPGGAAIHDSLVLHHVFPGILVSRLGPVQLGIHHQKVWVVNNGKRLLAWVGGVDFNKNRSSHNGPGFLHDVQVELEGPTAADVYEMLRSRWNTHPDAPSGVTLPAIPPTAMPGAGQRTRLVTTFGDPTKFAGLGPAPGGGTRPAYPFAPRGSQTIKDLVFHAIDKSERFIYLEDQYLVDEGVAKELAKAMPHLKALIIVMCDTGSVNNELFQGFERRRRFFGHLAPHAPKVAVVEGNRLIHAKLWVFDDTIAVVGSANVNRRGFRHDSEAAIAFGDLGDPGLVKKMRQDLWDLHLGTHAPNHADPPEASLPIWHAPPSSTAVRHYDPLVGRDLTPVHPQLARLVFTVDEFWDIVDPDG